MADPVPDEPIHRQDPRTCKLHLMLKPETLKKILPPLLAAAFCALNLWVTGAAVSADTDPSLHTAGSFLLAGLPGGDVNFNMPLFGTVFAAARNFGVTPVLFFVILHLANYALVFFAGSLLRGYRAGLLALAAAGLFEALGGFAYNAEQSFYSFFLLLALLFLVLKDREDTLKNNLLAGLAIGASLLVRTPLLLFPPLVVLSGRFWKTGLPEGRAARELAFLAASYALLLPWGALNQSVSGKFSLFDDRRAACNLITAAKGSVYTMNGNPFRLAGIGEEDSAFDYFVRETARAPLDHALTAVKRLWHIFLFHPLLSGLFLLALLKNRFRDGPAFGLPVYFVLVHSLLSIEARYFYPLVYLLPPLIAAGLLRGGQEGSVSRAAAEKAARAAFAISFCAVLTVEALVLAYPYRAAVNAGEPNALSRAALRFPEDKTLQGLGCREKWLEGDDGGFYNCLAGLGRKFGDTGIAYLVAASEAPAAAELAPPLGCGLDCLVMRMLRELELGDCGAAGKSLEKAYAAYQADHNMLRRAPYEKDKELELAIKEDSATFWQSCVYPRLLLRPPENMARILAGLDRLTALDGRLALLRDALRDVGTAGEFGDRPLRNWLATGVLGLSRSGLRKLWRTGAEQSRGLCAGAGDKARAGDLKSAEPLYGGAAGLVGNPETAPAFMALCSLRVKVGNKARALSACQSAAYASYFEAEGAPPAMGAEASFEVYKLLKGLGRKAEAEAALRRTIDNAPPSWPGLPAAKVLLK